MVNIVWNTYITEKHDFLFITIGWIAVAYVCLVVYTWNQHCTTQKTVPLQVIKEWCR